MAIEEALWSRLQAVTAVTDLVATRVFPVKKSVKDPAFPYVTFEQISAVRHSAMTADTGDATAEWRFHAWGKDSGSQGGFDSARAVVTAIRGALQRFAGTVAGTEIKGSFVIDEFDIGDDEPGVYHRVIDFEITWAE